MWLSWSPDLRHWGDHKLLLEARDGAWWDAGKIGLGPPPLETGEGWLILYHGVHSTSDGPIYRVGLALLAIDDPGTTLHRTDEWVFGPSAPYEITGDVGRVVFPCGWIHDEEATAPDVLRRRGQRDRSCHGAVQRRAPSGVRIARAVRDRIRSTCRTPAERSRRPVGRAPVPTVRRVGPRSTPAGRGPHPQVLRMSRRPLRGLPRFWRTATIAVMTTRHDAPEV